MGRSTTGLRNQAQLFMMQNRAAVLGTVNNRRVPHVATVYCWVSAKLDVYFVTRTESRKYRNLVARPTVAMTFTDKDNVSCVQLTGQAERVSDIKDEQDILFKLQTLRYQEAQVVSPALQLYERDAASELAVVIVRPTELTFASFMLGADGRYNPTFTKIIEP